MYSPVKTPNIARLIKTACDLNIMCYDNVAEKGRISKKLIYIMMNVIDLNMLGKPTHLFVSPAMVPELSEMAGYFKPRYIEGLEVRYVDGLDHGDDWNIVYPNSCGRHLKYFASIGGSLAYDKNSLVLMGTTEKVLLGCY